MVRKVTANAAPGATPNADFSLVLAKRVTTGQAFLLLILSIAAGSVASIAAATKQPLLGVVVAALAVLMAVLGRKTVTTAATKTGPLWCLSPGSLNEGQRHIEEAADKIAGELGLPTEKVRADVFAPDDTGHMLYMVPGLNLRMSEAEKSLHIPEGFGVTGACFQRRVPVVAAGSVLRGGVVRTADGKDLVTPFWIGQQESAKLNPDLSWVISAPIFDAESRLVGVVCVDGLQEPPASASVEDKLQDLQHWVVDAAAKISLLVPSA